MANEFKKIEGKFKLSFDNGERHFDYDVQIGRHLSGAFKYGNRSSHRIDLNGEFYSLFDTRYEQIPTNKEEWVSYWTEWVKEQWSNNSNVKVELVDYKEEFIPMD